MGTGHWLGPSSEVAPLDVARTFGQRVAEAPIQDDMRGDAALGTPRDHGLFVDTSVSDADDNMIAWMGLRNNLPTERMKAMRDYRHRRGTYTSLPAGEWRRPDAVCHTATAREYYEIKPMSDPGIIAANEKFAKIDKFITMFKLPYTRGVRYMADGRPRRKEIMSNNSMFRLMLNNLLRMFKLRNIRLFVVWERPAEAMIVYTLEVEVETEDNRNQKVGAMRNLARFAAQLAIRAIVPEATGSLVLPPQGVITVQLPPELADFKEAITASTGGMVFDAVPGETHLLVIEEEGFQRIIERQRRLPPLLRSAGPMFITEEWRRVLRESAADQARLRDQAILIAGAVLIAGVALYVCWPVVAAGAATVTVAGTGAAATTGGELATLGSEGQQVMRVGTTALQAFLRSPAANDNAVQLAKVASFALIPAAYVFGNVNDAAAAESLALKGTAPVSSINFDVAWILRTTQFTGPGPAQFGDVVDGSLFGLVDLINFGNAFLPPGNPKPSSKMRLIGRVRFI